MLRNEPIVSVCTFILQKY